MLYAKIYKESGKTWEVYAVREYEDRDGGDNLSVRVEQAEDRKNYCEWILPDIFCCKSYGFSEDDEFYLESYLRDNEAIIWDDWKEAQAIA